LKIKHTALLFSLSAIVCSGCLKPSKTMEEMKPYEGPIMVIENMETIYSDSAEMKVKLKAPRQEELQNGNREFPKGVRVEFYENGTVRTVLTSNFGRFYKELNKYMVSGDVVIKSLTEEKKLNTEELFWLPAEERIYVDKSKQVIITTKDGVLHGKGLEAKQDFSTYKILNPTSDGITVK
jgi:LPS export ABC transporter protein LptC